MKAFGARAALGAVGGGLVLSAVVRLPWRLPAPGELDVAPSPWPVDPPLVIEPSLEAGPVRVTVEYRVAAERHAAFRGLMRELGRARRRTGAEQWGLFQDGSDPDCFVETFLVATWEEHLRQHGERSTASDRALLERAAALASEGPRVRHLFYAYGEPALAARGAPSPPSTLRR